MVRSALEVGSQPGPLRIALRNDVLDATLRLRDFLYERVYDLPQVRGDFIKSAKIIREIYAYFMENQDAFRREVGETFAYEPVDRAIIDFIAGMTDRFAFKLYEKIFLPQPWLIV